MLVTELLFALLSAGLFSSVYFLGFRRSSPWLTGLMVFLLILVAVWAAGVWFRPAGPTLWNVYWAPFLWVGLFIAFLLAAATPSRPPRSPEAADAPPTAPATSAMALGVFFWLLLVLLLAAVVLSYI